MQHASDCAVHNAPALPPGPCDCGARIAELEEFKRDATDRLQVLTMALMRIECETDCDHARALAKAAFWKQPE